MFQKVNVDNFKFNGKDVKKKIGIPIVVIAVLIILAVGYYFMPKTLGKNVNPSAVDHISVFDGNTGTGFTITNPAKLGHILDDMSLLRDYSAESGEFIKYKGCSYCWTAISQEEPIFLTKKDGLLKTKCNKFKFGGTYYDQGSE